MSNQTKLFVEQNNLILTCIELIEQENVDTHQKKIINQILSDLDLLLYKCTYLSYYEIYELGYTFFRDTHEYLQIYNINSNQLHDFCKITMDTIIKFDHYKAINYIYTRLNHLRKILIAI